MKKIFFGILMLLVSLKTVCAIDNVRITLSIDEENHIMKQIVVDNEDEEFTMFLPESGKIPGSFYGYYVDLKGQMITQGTTPRRLTDLIGSLCDLTSGSGDKGTPVVFIQGYFDNLADD